jgi:hypothetical protein
MTDRILPLLLALALSLPISACTAGDDDDPSDDDGAAATAAANVNLLPCQTVEMATATFTSETF